MDIVVSEHGNISNQNIWSVLYDDGVNREALRNIILSIVREDFNGEFRELLRDAMEQIADEEVDKMLKD